MTPGGKVGHRAFAAVVRGNDDGMKRRPVALGQAISGFRLLSTGSGSRGKKKGRLPDGDGPQQFEPRGGLVCCSGRSHDLRGSCETTRAASTMLTAPGRGSTVRKVTCRKFGGRQPDADGPDHDGSLFVWLPHRPSRPQSRQRPVVISKMETASLSVAAGQGREKKSPAQGCPRAGPPDKKRYPTTFYSGDLYVVLDFL